MFLAVLSKLNINLSCYELETLGSITKSTRIDKNILLFDQTLPFSRLAYTKAVYRVHMRIPSPKSMPRKTALNSKTPHDELRTALNKLKTALYKMHVDHSCTGTFAARILREEDIPLPCGEREFGQLIWSCLKKPKVDLNHPDTTFVLFLTKNYWFICTQVWVNTDRFEDRRNHLLPEPHPTGLHPRLARALVNILNKKSFLDPFCGSGGILLEGALVGCTVRGTDIDSIQVNRAKINLAHFGFSQVSLEVKDALTIKKKFPGIVTDLPYGKNSKLADMQKTYRNFMKTASHITNRMVVCMPDINPLPFLKGTTWVVEKSFTLYLHRSLSKRVLVLRRRKPSFKKIQ